MSFDISDTLQPKSDQLDAIELASGARVFTIEKVTRNNDDQPINVHLREFPRPWRPSKGMRRVLAYCWGTNSSVWVGRRVELFYDPEVTFGKDKPGGTRIRALSHIDGVQHVPLLVARGKSAKYAVQPLKDAAPAPDYAAQITTTASKQDLNRIWQAAKDAGHLNQQIMDALAARGAQFDAEITDDPADGGES